MHGVLRAEEEAEKKAVIGQAEPIRLFAHGAREAIKHFLGIWLLSNLLFPGKSSTHSGSHTR
jgi:hypothetical protein